MVLRVVRAANILNIEHAGAIFIDLLEGATDDLLAVGGEGASDLTEKFVVNNGAVMVAVEGSEEQLVFLSRAVQLVVPERLGELVVIETARAVIVHNAELPAESEDAAGSARGQGLADASYQAFESEGVRELGLLFLW